MIQLLPIGCGLILGSLVSEAIVYFNDGKPIYGAIAIIKALGWVLVTGGLIAMKNR